MGAFPEPTGVGVGDKSAIKQGFNDIAKGMVYNPVSVGGRADQAGFPFIDHEGPIGTRDIGLPKQLLL